MRNYRKSRSGYQSINNRPVKRLTLVVRLQLATGLLYWTACRLELWDSDAVFVTQNLDVGYNVDQLQLHAYIGKKQRLVFLIHAHIAVTTVLI